VADCPITLPVPDRSKGGTIGSKTRDEFRGATGVVHRKRHSERLFVQVSRF
jgi:hypothetical protein